MAFREVRVFEVREVLRLWLAGEGFRATGLRVGFDRKTVRRYVEAAMDAGLVRDDGVGQLTDEFIGVVVEAVRPHRSDGHGEAWRLLGVHHDEIAGWVAGDLTAVKMFELLERRGVSVPCRTVQRYVAEVCGRTRGRGSTVRVADGEPGDECQIDFGRMGLVFDPVTGRNRVVHALIFTAVFSRHCFVWLTYRQTTNAVIAGCEAAWVFFGGVFKTLIPDNMSAIVERADALEPRLNQAFVEYAQARGFVVDPARVRSPQDSLALNAKCSSCAVRSSPVSPSSTLPTCNVAPRAGVGSGRGCGCMARPSNDRSRCSPPKKPRGCCRHRPASMTSRSTRRRRCIVIITSRSPGRSTRSRAA